MLKTFVIIKPDALQRVLGSDILTFLKERGLKIERMKKVIVQKEKILAHYDDVIKRLKLDYFPSAILKEFEGKEVWILLMSAKEGDPVALTRKLIGATDPAKAEKNTVRGTWGLDTLQKSINEKRMLQNLIHASDSLEAVEREQKIWFN